MIRVSKSRLHGLGLFARKSVTKGECVLHFDKNCGGSVMALDDFYGRYMNHSGHPTCCADGYRLLALRDICTGDEITIDYASISVPVHDNWKNA